MALKAVKPEIVKPSKPKFMISGKSGVGKTQFALSFPQSYFFDTEGGAVREQYMKKLIENKGVYFGKDQGSQDFKLVVEEVKLLATTQHDFRTMTLDSFTKIYNAEAAIAELAGGSEYGRDKKEANKPTRQLLRWFDKIDMTVIIICHEKNKYNRKGTEMTYAGTTFDGWEKLEYDLDLWIEIQKVGKERTFIVKKSRVASFVEGTEHPLDYKYFCDLYGTEIMAAASKPLVMATPAQVLEIKKLIELVRVDEELVKKWLKKARAEDFEEMSKEQIESCIAFVKTKIKDAETVAEKAPEKVEVA